MRSLICSLITGMLIQAGSANAEPPVRATADIMAYDIQGVNLNMTPGEVRDSILSAGYTDVSAAIPGLWEFTRGRHSMAVTHYDGKVESIGFSLISQGNGYLEELDRMRDTFAINLEDAGADCQYNAERGGACAVGDALDDSLSVTAYVQGIPMMLNMSVSRTDLRR